jgi:AraC-like DNA-binding protein
MLEQRSHYSRRALQYAFRKRLGCTATQWIRRERLELARRDLQHPSPADSVAVIALRCGYRSLSLFSVEFQQRFHVKPSQLLREARASQPAGRDS